MIAYHSVILKELDTAPKKPEPVAVITPPLVADAGELFAECFKIPDPHVKLSAAHPFPVPLGPPLISPRENPAFDAFNDFIDPADLYDMTSSQLYKILRNPQKRNLSVNQMRAAIAMLLQIPRENLSLRAVEDIFSSCDRMRTGSVSIDSFVETLDAKEKELHDQFRKIDKDNTGEISLEVLRAARAQGTLRMDNFEMEDLLDKMDGLTFTLPNPSTASSRKLQFGDFRAMVLPLPPAASIRTVIDLVRSNMNEPIDMSVFSM